MKIKFKPFSVDTNLYWDVVKDENQFYDFYQKLEKHYSIFEILNNIKLESSYSTPTFTFRGDGISLLEYLTKE